MFFLNEDNSLTNLVPNYTFSFKKSSAVEIREIHPQDIEPLWAEKNQVSGFSASSKNRFLFLKFTDLQNIP